MNVTAPVRPPAAPSPGAGVTTTDARAAQKVLRERLLGLGSDLAPAAYFASLEKIRAASESLQPQLTRLYSGAPIPLERDEQAAWQETIDLWLALHGSYVQLFEAKGRPAPEESLRAVLLQRSLHCVGRAMLEHARAYRAVTPALWKQLHVLYAAAEARELHEIAVDAPVDATPCTCSSTYREALLALAANTYALSPAQLPVALALAREWSSLVSLTTTAPVDATRSPHVVDLASSNGPVLARLIQQALPTVRHLASDRLAQRLREVATAVREGGTAPELAHAGALPRTATEKLLTHLYIQWCSAGGNRAEERRASTQRAQVSIHFHSIHFQISGRAFRQPGLRYTREEEHDLATFGHITERTESRLLTSRSSALEPWEIVNQGPTGVLGMNRKPDLQTRVGQGQLVAMRVSSTQPPMLGIVQRIREEADGSLAIGVRTMPVEVVAASVRSPGNPKEKFHRALLVAADAERGQPETLLVPPGTFRQGMVLELATQSTQTVRMTALVDAGANFERITFAAQ